MKLKDALQDIFTRGVGAWADSQVAQRYYVNDPTLNSAANALGAQRAGAGQFPTGLSVPPWVLIAAGVALVAVIALRK